MSIHEQTATELLAAMGEGRLTSVEIVRALIARREAVGARTNAIVVPLDQSALAGFSFVPKRPNGLVVGRVSHEQACWIGPESLSAGF